MAGLWRRPSFGLYLAALLLLPVSGIAPLGWLNPHTSWTDLLVAAAAVAWVIEPGAVRRTLAGPTRAVVAALGAFVLLSALSAAAATDRRSAAVNVVLAAELVVLALLTADFARRRPERNAIVLAIALGAVLTIALTAVGVMLFYAGIHTSLTGVYGEQLIPSRSYVRPAAGFASPPLLANYCIAAAAVVAMDSDVSPRLRRAIELALGVVVILTVSRAVLGFFVAMAIRGATGSSKARRLAAATAFLAVVAMATLTVGRLHLDPTRPSTISFVVPDPGNRREAFARSFDTLTAHPILGLGPGTFPGENRGNPFRAHFTPLNVAATVGLPGLAALTTALAWLWTGRRRPTDIALWSGLAGLAIDAMGQDIEHFRHVWILLGLAAASMRTRSAEATEPPPEDPGDLTGVAGQVAPAG